MLLPALWFVLLFMGPWAMAIPGVDAPYMATTDIVYVATNRREGNTVAAFSVSREGAITKIAEYPTGGNGTGDLEVPALRKDPTHPLANGDDPLISAYGIRLTRDRKHLLAVNPGSASVSLMKVMPDGALEHVNTVDASDRFPVSVAEADGKVVVASVGSSNKEGSIAAFKITDGTLQPVKGSRRDLNARPSTVAFSSDGRFVILSELVTGKIRSYGFETDTLSMEPVSTVDSPRGKERFQAIPVGLDIARHGKTDVVVVSEARFLTPDFKLREEAGVVPQSPKYSWQTGSLSSYTLDGNGTLKLVSADVLTGSALEGGEVANCWVEFSRDGKLLWAANALSSSISAFAIAPDGTASLSQVLAYKDPTQAQFLSDLKLSEDGTKLFQLVGNMGQVLVLSVEDNGMLKLEQSAGALPSLGAFGLETLSVPPLPTSATARPVGSGLSRHVGPDGTIRFPADFQASMIHLGSWFVPEGDASGFHDVYAEATSLAAFRTTGRFPDGATLVKVLRSADSGNYTTGQNVQHTTGHIKQWFVMIKDSKNRFADKPQWGEGWGWALFKPGETGKNAVSDFRKDCLGCHLPVKNKDWVYTEAYPVLRGK